MRLVKAAWRCQDVWVFRYADDMSGLAASSRMRVLILEDEPPMAEAIRDGLRLEAIAADIAGDGDSALDQLSVNAYDIVVLDRDIPGPLTKPFALQELVLRLRGLDRRRVLKRAWDENADPFTNAVRVTVSAMRNRVGEPGCPKESTPGGW
jgi:DNA-binding response OmpR family regulator